MDFIWKKLEKILKNRQRLTRHKRMATVLSAIVVFTTTYAMILPAITLETDVADTEPGISLTSVEDDYEEDVFWEDEFEDFSETFSDEQDTQADNDESFAEDAEETDTEDKDESEKKNIEGKAYTARSAGYQVVVTVPDGAFDEEVTLHIEPFPIEELSAESTALLEEQGIIDNVALIDISFINEDGEEVEPKGTVSVKLKVPEAEFNDEAYDVYHIEVKDDERNLNQVGTIDNREESTVQKNTAEFDTDSFSVYVIAGVETITTHMITASGDTYEISVTYDETAEIPEGAVLSVTEITEADESFDVYAEQTADAVGSTVEEAEYIRLFDIKILSVDGEEIEPKVPVQVKVNYVEPVEVDADHEITVVHFGEENTEVITPEATGEEEGRVDAIAFEATSFSVYAISAFGFGKTTDLDGKSFVIMSDPISSGAMSKYNYNAVQGAAKSNDANKLNAVVANMRTDGSYLVSEDNVIWTFTKVANTTNQYYIQNENGSYLNIGNGKASVSSTRQSITVNVDNTNHKNRVRLTRTENRTTYALTNNANLGGFSSGTSNDNNSWLTLVESSKMHLDTEYTSTKVSVANLKAGKSYIVYHRVFNETLNTYENYVIDGAGKLIKAYDKGDQITLRSAVDPRWKLTIGTDSESDEIADTYVLQNMTTPNLTTPNYMAPGSGDACVSDQPADVLLAGITNKTYGSTIERWDDTAKAYIGLKVVLTESGFTIENAAQSESEEFFFAEVHDKEENQLHTVATIDSSQIKINMFDYPSRDAIENISGAITYVEGPGGYSSYVGTKLVNGYPVFANGASSSQLFSPDSSYYQGPASNLFLQSVYDATGYYEYNAFNNFAEYNKTTQKFTVYQEIATPLETNIFYYKRGNFYPYNTISQKKQKANINENNYDGSGEVLDALDPTLKDRMYMLDQTKNDFFGMTLESTFFMPRNGQLNGMPVLYEFNGDDDLWIYIDDVLVLDIGGVHDAMPGSINFETGVVTGRTKKGIGTTTIKQRFKEAGIFPDGTSWDDSKVDQYFNGDTFIDYGSHTFKMFYMEHGAGASNLEMRFNLPVIEKGKFTVEKKLEGTTQEKFANVYFAYQAFKKNGAEDVPLTSAVYEGTTEPVVFRNNINIGGKIYNNVFYLKPGEAATFAAMDENTEYYVQEIGIGSDYYNEVTVNEVKIDGEAVTETDGVYKTSVSSIVQRARVSYTNKCAETNKNELRITKNLKQGSVDDGSLFAFRVNLENKNGQMSPYAAGKYYIKDAKDDYYRYKDGQLVNNGKSEIIAGSADNNGVIAGIPAGYTVVIKDLLAGTEFATEEVQIPDGWVLDSKTMVEDTYDTTSVTGADGQIKLDTDAQVIYTNKANKKIVVKKEWNSGDFVTKHGNINVALFTEDSQSHGLNLVSGSVRTLVSGATSTEYLVTGDLSSYVVREVIVDGETVTPVGDRGAITVSGESTTLSKTETYDDVYYVTYEEKTAADVTGEREVTITNTLPKITVKKTDLNGDVLKGAEFKLMKEDKSSVGKDFDRIVTDKDGLILNEQYLPKGVYYLTETKAPDGYLKLTYDIKITVENNGNAIIGMMSDEGAASRIFTDQTSDNVYLFTYAVENNPGAKLPHTGGMGTRWYTIIGMGMIFMAALLWALRYRRVRERR